MNHKCIGKIIKEYRTRKGMSRKTLASNLCSEKYIYLIERGERTPSVDMVRILGDKLGVDLFEYFEYIDCMSPIEVNETIKLFNKFRAENDMNMLEKITEKAAVLPDFIDSPWSFEIETNKIICLVLKENKIDEAIKRTLILLNQEKKKYHESINIANVYAILSICYQMKNDFRKAEDAIMRAYSIIDGKEGILKYLQIIITVKLTDVILLYGLGKFDEVIEKCRILMKYQIDTSSYERFHYMLFYMAFALYDKDMKKEALEWFKKALNLSAFRYKPMDIYYISLNKTFGLLMEDKKLPKEIVRSFKKMYNMEQFKF